jgi:hypothetical protein
MSIAGTARFVVVPPLNGGHAMMPETHGACRVAGIRYRGGAPFHLEVDAVSPVLVKAACQSRNSVVDRKQCFLSRHI